MTTTVFDRATGPLSFVVQKGRRYRAHVHLGLVERTFATDAMLAEKFAAVGFEAVNVVGEGAERWAFGTRTEEDARVTADDLPEQVVRVDLV